MDSNQFCLTKDTPRPIIQIKDVDGSIITDELLTTDESVLRRGAYWYGH